LEQNDEKDQDDEFDLQFKCDHQKQNKS